MFETLSSFVRLFVNGGMTSYIAMRFVEDSKDGNRDIASILSEIGHAEIIAISF